MPWKKTETWFIAEEFALKFLTWTMKFIQWTSVFDLNGISAPVSHVGDFLGMRSIGDFKLPIILLNRIGLLSPMKFTVGGSRWVDH